MRLFGRKYRAMTVAAVGIGLATAMTLSGCEVSGASAGAPTSACTSPGVTPSEVQVGLVYSDTGPHAPDSIPARSGAQARVELANGSGGVHGRKIAIQWRDDASDPMGNLTAAQELVEGAGVFGVLSETAAATGSAGYLADRHIPVAGVAAEPVWAEHRNMFTHEYLFTDDAITTFGVFTKKMGGTRAFVLLNSFAEVSRIAAQKMEASLTSQGIKVVGSADVITAGSAAAASIVAQIRASGADVLVGGIPGSAFAEVLSAAQQAGMRFKAALNPVGYDRKLLEKHGTSIAGMTVYLSHVPFESTVPALQAHRDAMTRYAPELTLSDPDSDAAMLAYISADLFIRGLEVAGPCPTRDGFIASLRQVRDYDAGGLLPAPVDLEENFGAVGLCYFFVRVNQGGTSFETVSSGSPNGDGWCGDRL